MWELSEVDIVWMKPGKIPMKNSTTGQPWQWRMTSWWAGCGSSNETSCLEGTLNNRDSNNNNTNNNSNNSNNSNNVSNERLVSCEAKEGGRGDGDRCGRRSSSLVPSSSSSSPSSSPSPTWSSWWWAGTIHKKQQQQQQQQEGNETNET